MYEDDHTRASFDGVASSVVTEKVISQTSSLLKKNFKKLLEAAAGKLEREPNYKHGERK